MDISKLTASRSDQLNADDINNPIVIKVESVEANNAPTNATCQIAYGDKDGRVFRPCLTTTRIMQAAWGDETDDWIGKSMELYNDPKVKMKGVQVGGIRISKVSHITETIKKPLADKRGSKKIWTIEPLRIAHAIAPPAALVEAFANMQTIDQLKELFIRQAPEMREACTAIKDEAKARIEAGQ